MKVEDILTSHGLKRTKARISVLKVFQKSTFALSQPYLEKKITDVDRTTLYRILNDFVLKGILHPVVSEKGLLHYSICSDKCGQGHHQDNHVHFECSECNAIFCLDNVRFPKVKLNDDFHSEKFDYKIIGKCKRCNKK
jgi:Fur family ferric uptake transcriptional regulator